jgi:Predicted solute binding protein
MQGNMRRVLSILILVLLFPATALVVDVMAYSPTGDPILLLWLVPWGPSNGTYTNLLPYLPRVMVGVVFAFHTDGLGNGATLQEALAYNGNGYWISEQLSKLQAVYNSSSVVFVNFFLTTSTWRGYLTSVTQPQLLLLNYTLMQIASITNGGERLVVGVSEMNDLDDYGYYQVYSLIRQDLPHAQLFYYTDLGQSVSSIESVFTYLRSNGITLNYLGYDVYPYPSYDYFNGQVQIPGNFVSQISALQSFAQQNGVNFFIGEVGFRDGDVLGYENPSATAYIDFNAPVGYQDTINYYEDVISQLSSMGVTIIGIWNYNGWNGDPFGVWYNPYFDQLLEFVGIKPIETANIEVVSPVPVFYINGSKYYTNGTYTVTLPVNISFDSLYYINGSVRMILEGVEVNGLQSGGSFVVSRPGTYQITAKYLTQYYVTVNLNVSAYVNGIKEELTSGWYDMGTMIQVYPQVIHVGPYEVYNITTPYSFIVNSPGLIRVPCTVEYYVKIMLPNGTIAGWYANGSVINLPKTVYVNGKKYVLVGPDQIVVNGPIVSARPMYVQVTTTSTSTTATTPTTSTLRLLSANYQASQTTTSSTASTITSSTITISTTSTTISISKSTSSIVISTTTSTTLYVTSTTITSTTTPYSSLNTSSALIIMFLLMLIILAILISKK